MGETTTTITKPAEPTDQPAKNGYKIKNMNGFMDNNNRPKKQYLNFGHDDQMEIAGYAINKLKTYFIYLWYLLTLGLLRLFFHWYPQLHLKATHSPCPLDSAEKILITDKYKGKYKSFFVKAIEILKAEDYESTSCISLTGLILAKENNENRLLTVYLEDGTIKKMKQMRIIRCKKMLYVWVPEKYKFVKMSGLDNGVKNSEIHQHQGYSKYEQSLKRITYGTNEINVPVQSVVTLLVLEALTPFYMFQLFSLIVWLAEYYYYYTGAIAIMSAIGISTSIIQTRRNQKNLKGTVHLTDKVLVSRDNGKFDEVPTTDLVPGDLIMVPAHGCEMQCDAVLLNGNCIVNESMLTGESVPITKTALPNDNRQYDVKEHSNHTLFCGTKVIQTRYYGEEPVVAVVIRTGYLTSKGGLVRSILYPPPADFKFDQDSYKYIMLLAVFAVIGVLYTVFSKYYRNVDAWDIIIKALDVITIAIPPALPAAMTVGKLYAINRLKKRAIYCINSRVINVSGSVNCICFDKTGTLTEDGLDMWGVVPVDRSQILEPIKEVNPGLTNSSNLFKGMLTCHSLTLIEQELSGDPLDVKMFEATGWVLEEPTMPDTTKYDLLVPTIVKSTTEENNEIGIIQQYQFSSSLQRMSVITRKLGTDWYQVYCKGSPEMIISLSKPETVPPGILEKLQEYTEQGYRVIGMGTKRLPEVPFHKIPKLLREEIECDLEFCGLIILENRLKPETSGIIKILRQAGMKLVMITGDNIATAISVGRECGIIQPGYNVIEVTTSKPNKLEVAKVEYQWTASSPSLQSYEQITPNDIEKYQERKYQLVITGTAWGNILKYFPHLIPRIATKGVIFARMSGNQKQQLIEELQNLGYYVAMCGDGANDCGALKAAHVGISLSEAESSVASPFTSKEANISCVAKVVLEGRAALVTSFGVFKMMVCYSLSELASVLILYSIDSNLTSFQFLFIDIFLILVFASFFGKTKAYPKLHKTPPMTSLLNIVPLFSIIFFIAITIIFQVIAFYGIQYFDWFVPFQYDPSNTNNYVSYENYSVFCVSMFQYIILAIVFSKGKPYRMPIYTNYILTFCIVVLTTLCIYLTVYPDKWFQDLFELKLPAEINGAIMVLVLAVINIVACFMAEDLIVDRCIGKFVATKIVDKSKHYIQIEYELNADSSWPPNSWQHTGNNHQKIDDCLAFDERYETDKNGGIINGGYIGNEITKL